MVESSRGSLVTPKALPAMAGAAGGARARESLGSYSDPAKGNMVILHGPVE